MYDLLNRRDLETIEQLGLRTINMKENAEFSKVILDDFLPLCVVKTATTFHQK